MADVPAAAIHATHEVEYQPPPFEDVNLFASDRGLKEATTREGAGWAAKRLGAFGAEAGSARVFELGRQGGRAPARRRHRRSARPADQPGRAGKRRPARGRAHGPRPPGRPPGPPRRCGHGGGLLPDAPRPGPGRLLRHPAGESALPGHPRARPARPRLSRARLSVGSVPPSGNSDCTKGPSSANIRFHLKSGLRGGISHAFR